jgi:hypothetical protein
MRRSGTGSGGGIGMNKNVQPSVRTGSGSKSTRPAGVSQLGYMVGDKATHERGSTGYRGGQGHARTRFDGLQGRKTPQSRTQLQPDKVRQ